MSNKIRKSNAQIRNENQEYIARYVAQLCLMCFRRKTDCLLIFY